MRNQTIKQMKHFLSMAAIALVGAMTIGCSSTEDVLVADSDSAANRMVTLTTTISLGGGTDKTRALTAAGVKTFAEGDAIAVKYYSKGTYLSYEFTAISTALTETDISSDGKTATFTVTLENPDPDNTEVRYVYPAYLERDDIRDERLGTEQDGTLETIASKFDYCEATGAITYTGDTPQLPSLTLQNKLALCQFTFSDGTDNITSSLKKLMIEDGTNTYLVRPSNASTIWVAMNPVVSSRTITLTAYDGTDFYERSVTGKRLAANNIYPITVTTPKGTSDRMIPLTFEAKEADATVTFDVFCPVEYRTYNTSTGEWSEWSEYTSKNPIALAAEGDAVSFRGNNPTYFDESASGCPQAKISCTGDLYLYGNFMSLVNAKEYPIAKELTNDNTFRSLFKSGQQNIYNHPTHSILLPATKITANCYNNLFSGFDNLTVAPALPAQKLVSHCYAEMFRCCTSLVNGPVLPATELVENCYESMFWGCGNLETVTCLFIPNENDPHYQHAYSSSIDNWLGEEGNWAGTENPIFYKAAGAEWPEGSIPEKWTVRDDVVFSGELNPLTPFNPGSSDPLNP